MKLKKETEQHFGLTYLATGEETGGAYFLAHMRVPSGDPGPPPHIHEREDEGFHMINGQLTFDIDGKEVILRTGEFLNIQKGERHSWRNESENEAALLVIFSPAGIEEMFSELDLRPESILSIGEKFGTHFFLD